MTRRLLHRVPLGKCRKSPSSELDPQSMKAGNKNEGQQTARPNEGIWIISWTSKRTVNTHIWFPSHKSNPATRACGVRFLRQHYNTTGHVRRLEDSVTPLRMACSRGTANKAPRETPGGARRAADHGKTTAEFPPTRDTVMAPGWRASLKAKRQNGKFCQTI